MDWQIPLSDLDYGSEEAAAVERVLQSRWLSMGPETKAFEEEFAAHAGCRHAIAVSNGTAALHLACLALGLGPGQGVIQPPVNFVAAANMTVATGAVPLFADICSLDEPTISPESLKRLLSTLDLQRSLLCPKAVVVMHYGGYFCRMAEILALCQEYGLALIEDACHAVGAEYCDAGGRPPHGHKAGDLGDIGCFSFFGNKNLATGEGGMLTTNRDDIADKARNLRSHGMSTLTWDRHRGHAATYDVLAHGYNYRLDDLRSALGREQLKKLERNNQRRRELTALYWRQLEPLEACGWILPFRHSHATRNPQHASRFTTSAHLMAAVAPDARTRWRCAEALKTASIQTSLHYPLVPSFAAFHEGARASELATSKRFCERVITLPLYPTMTEEQVEQVCERLVDTVRADG